MKKVIMRYVGAPFAFNKDFIGQGYELRYGNDEVLKPFKRYIKYTSIDNSSHSLSKELYSLMEVIDYCITMNIPRLEIHHNFGNFTKSIKRLYKADKSFVDNCCRMLEVAELYIDIQFINPDKVSIKDVNVSGRRNIFSYMSYQL